MLKSDPSMLFLSKVLSSKKGGKAATDRGQYDLAPGEHHLKGTISYDITAEVGEDTTANRSYGVPVDSILDLASHMCGALRPHLHKAASVATELTKAKLEGREVRSARYTYGGEDVVVPRGEVRRLAAVLADSGSENLSRSIKMARPYVGAIKIKEAKVTSDNLRIVI